MSLSLQDIIQDRLIDSGSEFRQGGSKKNLHVSYINKPKPEERKLVVEHLFPTDNVSFSIETENQDDVPLNAEDMAIVVEDPKIHQARKGGKKGGSIKTKALPSSKKAGVTTLSVSGFKSKMFGKTDK